MKSVPLNIPTAILALALLAAPAAALAQTQVPTREDNVWDWRDHQPTEAQIQENEQAAGVAPTPSQEDSSSATVDQLYRQLLDRSRD